MVILFSLCVPLPVFLGNHQISKDLDSSSILWWSSQSPPQKILVILSAHVKRYIKWLAAHFKDEDEDEDQDENQYQDQF